ncbi:serine hydrolase domain-containing protein [Flavobacterium sp. RHBU_24]|uniref:serine hydrolase domain-containing protein n=1 Tax=Flavobacterium sp. RHBU_24 TaxID=3391185 RepID=UPI003984A3BE
MRILLLCILAFYTCTIYAQTANLYQTDGITTELHRQNIGKVTFMDGNIPIENYTAADFLKKFKLTHQSNLNVRMFLDNSIINYLHRLAPEVSADRLLKMGNLQCAFYVDGAAVYTENIHYGCNFGQGSGSKNTATVLRIPLTSPDGEDLWGLHMWDRFMLNGGEKALTDGNHTLKIEIRPYIAIDETTIKTGAVVAQGQLKLIIKTPKITAKQIKVQPIAQGSGWGISPLPYDRTKIEQLNKAIASRNLKDITSVVAVYESKLLLEEYFNGANRAMLHDTRSAGKSFTSTLMGLAINNGYIKSENEALGTFYNLKGYDNYNVKKDSIKIKDLLTMSSAFEGSDAHSDSPGNEENMYPTDNWVKFTLDLKMDTTKTNGGKWDYFTAGVVLLGDILDKNVPSGLEKYADDRLFKPLGIIHYQWQYTPQKVANTAGSLQMASLDYARYAQLYKNNGVWNGTQLLPVQWVQQTLSKQIQIPGRDNQFYGYLFWNKTVSYKGNFYETWYCAGNGGNEFIIFKDLPLVIIITSKAYGKPYGHPQADKIVHDYLLPAILK